MSKIDDALRFAIDAHAGMTRKGDGSPYILHPLEAATIAASMTHDEDVICAAVLHDVVEDTPTTLDDLREAFGDRVAQLVASETEDKRNGASPSESWLERKQESLERLRATEDTDIHIIWLADKLSNMRSFARIHSRKGNAMWERFNQKDPALHAWYYRQVADVTEDLSAHLAWQEYARLTESVFEDVI